MHLIAKCLHMTLHLQRLLERLHGLLILILAREHAHGDLDPLRILGIHHGRVHLRRDGKRRVLLRRQADNLPAPAHAQGAVLLDLRMGLLQRGHQGRLDGGDGLRGRGGAGEEVAEDLLVLVGLGGVDGRVEGLAAEEVRHEDLVFVGGVAAVAVGEDVGALQGLRGVAEDVVDDEDGGGGVRGADGVYDGGKTEKSVCQWYSYYGGYT